MLNAAEVPLSRQRLVNVLTEAPGRIQRILFNILQNLIQRPIRRFVSAFIDILVLIHKHPQAGCYRVYLFLGESGIDCYIIHDYTSL